MTKVQLYRWFIFEGVIRSLLPGIVWGLMMAFATTGFRFDPALLRFLPLGLLMGAPAAVVIGLMNGIVLGALTLTVFIEFNDFNHFKLAMRISALMVTLLGGSLISIAIFLPFAFETDFVWWIGLLVPVVAASFAAIFTGHKLAEWYWQQTRIL